MTTFISKIKKITFFLFCSTLIFSQVQCGKSCSSEEEAKDKTDQSQKTDQTTQKSTANGLETIEVMDAQGKKVKAPKFLTWLPPKALVYSAANYQEFDFISFFDDFELDPISDKFIEVIELSSRSKKDKEDIKTVFLMLKDKNSPIAKGFKLFKQNLKLYKDTVSTQFMAYHLKKLKADELEKEFPLSFAVILEGKFNENNFKKLAPGLFGCWSSQPNKQMEEVTQFNDQTIYSYDCTEFFEEIVRYVLSQQMGKEADIQKALDELSQFKFNVYFSLVNNRLVLSNELAVQKELISLQQKPLKKLDEWLSNGAAFETLTFSKNNFSKGLFTMLALKDLLLYSNSLKANQSQTTTDFQATIQKNTDELKQVLKEVEKSGFKWLASELNVGAYSETNPRLDFILKTKIENENPETVNTLASSASAGVSMLRFYLNSPDAKKQVSKIDPKLFEWLQIFARVTFENQDNKILKIKLPLFKKDVKLTQEAIIALLEKAEKEIIKENEAHKQRPESGIQPSTLKDPTNSYSE